MRYRRASLTVAALMFISLVRFGPVSHAQPTPPQNGIYLGNPPGGSGGSCTSPVGYLYLGTIYTCQGGTWTATGGGGGSGTVTVVGSGTLVNGACVTGGGTTTLQTPATTCTIDSAGNVHASSGIFGAGSGLTGYANFAGHTSGGQGFTVNDIGGTDTLYVLPSGTHSGYFLADGGSATCPTLPSGAPSNCEALTWSSGSGGGGTQNVIGSANFTVTGGTIGGLCTGAPCLTGVVSAVNRVTTGEYSLTLSGISAATYNTSITYGNPSGAVAMPAIALTPTTSLLTFAACQPSTNCGAFVEQAIVQVLLFQ